MPAIYLLFFAGFCIVEESIPEAGSTVIGGEGESVTFYCRVLNETNGTQMTTEWFIQRIDAGSPQTIVRSPNFNITGGTLQTNLTIQNLTSDLDRATLSCGQGGTPPTIDANFTLRIYRKSVNVVTSWETWVNVVQLLYMMFEG